MNGVRKFVLIAMAATVMVGAGLPAAAKPRPKKALVVGTDAAGDWNDGHGAEAGNAAGQDLVKASVGMKGRNTIVFGIGVTALSAEDQRATAYSWGFTVGGTDWSLSKGCGDPGCAGGIPFTVSKCSPQSYGIVELTSCTAVETVNAEADLDSNTLLIPVPVKTLEARRGDVVAPTESGVSASPITMATVNGSSSPSDILYVTKTFTIPKR